MLTGIKFWLWLTQLLPPAQAWQVYQHFGSPERAYFSDPEEYQRIEGLSPEHRRLLLRKEEAPAEQVLSRCERQNIRILTFQDTEYPERLRNIEVPPLVLYLRGKVLRFDERAVVAIVGTRKATPYGIKLAAHMANGLTRGGAVVATGVVNGCDASAAKGALRAGGPLALVVAGGVDVPYYDTDAGRALLEDAASVGCVLSECPPGTTHDGFRFQRRNAILSGLAVAVLCVEGDTRSGAVGVAKLASEQGRDVFAIPGNVGSPQSRGTNDLLRAKLAHPAVEPEDILSQYPYLLPRQSAPQPPAPQPDTPQPKRPRRVENTSASPAQPKAKSPEAEEKGVDTVSNSGYIEIPDAHDRWSPEERKLLQALQDGPATAESLIHTTGLNAATTSASLVMLCVGGVIEECPGGKYRLRPQG